MSDFGSIILFGKRKGNFNDTDVQIIVNLLKKIIVGDKYPSNITEGNFAELRKWDDNSYCSIITAYYEDEDSEEIWKFAEENDIEECERIIQHLEPELAFDFYMEARMEQW